MIATDSIGRCIRGTCGKSDFSPGYILLQEEPKATTTTEEEAE